ncbi:MAG: aldehyde dehydrogenase EutE [Elusimicrobiota bacterium]|nr:aldehyde dehydrogenase EutE [Elusimicrobiota bacterium]
MEIDIKKLEEVVKEVVKRLEGKITSPLEIYKEPSQLSIQEQPKNVLCSSVEEAVKRSKSAQEVFQSMGLEVRKKLIDSIRQAAVKNAEHLAKIAYEETKMGRYEHKIQKNLLAATKTPGVEDIQPVVAYTGDRGMTLIEYAPFGVVAAVTPSTNPTSTIINNSISILSAGNSVIFAPHPAARKCSQETMRIINDAIVSCGGPKDLILTVEPASTESTQALLKHPDVKMILVTGGPAIVKIAMLSGKKTIAAGPGNPPVVVDETAMFPKCVTDIIDGASFDNGILCTAEKEVIVVEEIFEKFIYYFRQTSQAYELSKAQMDELAKIVIKSPGGPGKEPQLNRDYVGKDANIIAKAIGLDLPETVTLLWGIVPNDHPFVWTEQLMPVLPVTVAKNVDEAIKFAVEVEADNHHTAIMHSLNVANLSKMARAFAGSIFVKNGPSYMGLGMGEGYATLSIATPTGDGLTKARNFTRPLRCVLVDYFRIA